MKDYKFGDIVLLSFPYTNSSTYKKRPAMILLDTEDDDVIVTRITSHLNNSQFDSEIKEWEKAGLLFPSTIRLHKIATIEKQIIERKLGSVQDNDLDNAANTFQELLSSL